MKMLIANKYVLGTKREENTKNGKLKSDLPKCKLVIF